jgi:hypothetical protein
MILSLPNARSGGTSPERSAGGDRDARETRLRKRSWADRGAGRQIERPYTILVPPPMRAGRVTPCRSTFPSHPVPAEPSTGHPRPAGGCRGNESSCDPQPSADVGHVHALPKVDVSLPKQAHDLLGTASLLHPRTLSKSR